MQIKQVGLGGWLLAAVGMLSACGGGESGPAVAAAVQVNNPAFAEVLSAPLGAPTDCALQLSEDAAAPGQRIVISGVPAEMGDASIRVIAPAAEEGALPLVDPLLLLADAPAGERHFVVPLHPSGNAEGGVVLLELGDGIRACSALDFTIQPLPAAPANYTETVQARMEAYVDRLLEVMGYDPSALLAQAQQDVLPADFPLWLAKQFVSADREGSMARLAPANSADGDDLAERLMMASGLETELNERIDALAALPQGQLEPAGAEAKHGRRLWAGKSFATAKLGSCSGLQFDSRKLSIYSASELSARMLAANGVDNRLANYGNGAVLANHAALSTNAAAAQGGAFAGSALFLLTTATEAKMALEPRTIVDFDVRSFESLWIEDRPISREAKWSGATVAAEGSRFNITRAALQSLVAVLGVVPGPVGTAVTAAGAFAPNAVNGAIDSFAEGSCFQIAAPRYGPIDVSDEQWTASEVSGVFTDFDHRRYYATDLGAGEVKVRLRSEQFGVSGDFEQAATLQAVPIQISTSTDKVFVAEPGEVVELQATVINADTTQDDFQLVAHGAIGEVLATNRDGQFFTVRIKTNEDREVYPFELEFIAANTTLPLGSGQRSKRVRFDVRGSLDITPDDACLLPGQTLDVSAEIKGFQPGNDGVRWSASGGSLADETALDTVFTAPQSLGVVTLEIVSTTDGEVSDTVNYTVSAQCLRKIWYPEASFSTDGNGVYGGGPEDGSGPCPPGEHEETQAEELLTPGERIDTPPSEPAQNRLWFDHQAGVQALLNHNSTRYYTHNGSCGNASFTAESRGRIDYLAEGDGTLSLNMDAQVQAQCQRYSNENQDVECASAAAVAGAFGQYILAVDDQPATYRLTGSLQCGAMDGYIILTPFTITVARYVDGQPYEPSQGQTGVRDAQGNPRSPQLMNVSCSQANELIFIDETFTLDAAEAGQTDQVFLPLTGAVTVTPDVIEKDHFGPPNPFDPIEEPAPGTYSGQVELQFEIRLEAQ